MRMIFSIEKVTDLSNSFTLSRLPINLELSKSEVVEDVPLCSLSVLGIRSLH